MKGYGCSVFKGTKIERFDVEVLGVLKSVSPGRDLILARLSGCNLDKTCVIAGMSGSPVYIDGKLLGAVSYAWAFGKEPIAGVTPFCQMAEFVEGIENSGSLKRSTSRRVLLEQSISVADRTYDAVTIAGLDASPVPAAADGLWLTPLQTPLVAGGFSEHCLRLLAERVRWTGLAPMQGGRAPAHVLRENAQATLEPGSPVAVALITGDFDMSGIGTVTHVEGERVYAFGHPFMSIGQCELPMMTGYIHTIYPRQSVSFKMGSPLQTVGIIDADVSTCIAGRLGRKPDLLPLTITVQRDAEKRQRQFHCEVVRNNLLAPQLVFATLTNSIDMEGDLPDELTAEMHARLEFENRPPLVIHDIYSGPSYAGGRAPAAMYSQIGALLQVIMTNPFHPVRIAKLTCETKIVPGRSTAEIEAVELDSESYTPGATIKGTVWLKPHKSATCSERLRLKLPANLAEGVYAVQISDDLTNARQEIRESPVLSNPTNLDQVFQALEVQASAKRTNLTMRLVLNDAGVAVDGRELPHLPGSMVEMLANSRRTGAQTMSSAVVSRQPTPWVIQGSQTIKITVTKSKRITSE
jgi:hypothetical protein